MTIEDAKKVLSRPFNMKNVPQDILEVHRMAIASLNALEEIRQETMDAIEDGLYVGNTRILDIIDRHFRLREVKK